MKAWTLILLVAAPMATAQELPYSPEATETCLAKAILPSEDEACIGTSAQLCIDTPDGYTTVGMGFCLGYERDYWDARLNAAYGQLMEIEKSVDDEMTKLGSSVPSSASSTSSGTSPGAALLPSPEGSWPPSWPSPLPPSGGSWAPTPA